MKVTYLIGAGASAGTPEDPRLPVVANMPERLENFRKYIVKHGTTAQQSPIVDDLRSLISKLASVKTRVDGSSRKNYFVPIIASVDTYAKQLFIRGEAESFLKLKALLVLFFAFEQKARGVDVRYDSFFASLIKDSSRNLPPANIISWNYDLQFELAFARYLPATVHVADDLLEIQNHLNIFSKQAISSEKSTGWSKVHDEASFSIFKLNGSTSFHDREGQLRIPWTQGGSIDNLVDKILVFYQEVNDGKLTPSLSFSWEVEQTNVNAPRRVVDLAQEAVKRTDVLVIIGYSFPVFNRAIDQKLLQGMTPQVVYIQDLTPDKIHVRFEATFYGSLAKRDSFSFKPLFVPVLDTYQFAFPDEF